jgi:hypothetical protein
MGVALTYISHSDAAARWIRRSKVINRSGIRDIFSCTPRSSEMDICLGLVRFSYTMDI